MGIPGATDFSYSITSTQCAVGSYEIVPGTHIEVLTRSSRSLNLSVLPSLFNITAAITVPTLDTSAVLFQPGNVPLNAVCIQPDE